MATSGDIHGWGGPSCGQSFEDKSGASDHSDAVGDPWQGSSQQGGNTATAKDDRFNGQGTDSEATHDLADGDNSTFGDVHTVETALTSDAGKDDARTDTSVNSHGGK